MSKDNFHDPELLQDLIQDSEDNLSEIEPMFLKMEKDGFISIQEIDKIFRNLHSIKGGFRVLGFESITDLTHCMETIFSLIKDERIDVHQELISVLIHSLDKLKDLIQAILNEEEIDILQDLRSMLPYIDEDTKEFILKDYPNLNDTPDKGTNELKDNPIVHAEEDDGENIEKTSIEEVKEYIIKHQGPITFEPDHEDEYLQNTLLKVSKARSFYLIDGGTPLTNTESFLEKVEAEKNVFQHCILEVDGHPDLEQLFSKYSYNDKKILLIHSLLEKEIVVLGLDIDEDYVYDVDIIFPEELNQETAKAESPEAIEEQPQIEPTQHIPVVKPAKDIKDNNHTTHHDVDSIRVKVDILNSLMDSSGELILNRNQLLQSLNQSQLNFLSLEKVVSELDKLPLKIIEKGLSGNSLSGDSEYIDQIIHDEVNKIRRLLEEELAKPLSNQKNISSILQNLDRNTSHLQEDIMNTRMQPILKLFNKFHRVIQDLSISLSKEVKLEIRGRSVELDKTILEKLADPMVHLVRNSVDHGLETPDKRIKAGKPRQGTVILNAFHEGGNVIITIEDDGNGINKDKVLEKAIQNNITTPEKSSTLTDKQIYELIFKPGFSTAEQVSDISGRGVGMDVVKTNIESLGGNIEVDSKPGEGTTFIMKLPLTMAIIPSLIVSQGNLKFAIPQLTLEEIVRYKPLKEANKIEPIHNCDVLKLRDELLPLIKLPEVLKLNNADEADHDNENRYIIILKTGKQKFGLVVEGIQDNEELVIKPLCRYLNSTKCYSGTAILGNGDVAMILDVNGIIEHSQIELDEIEKKLKKSTNEQLINENTENQNFMVFTNHDNEKFALTLDLVSRVEKIKRSQIQKINNREYLNYDDYTIDLVRLESYLPIAKCDNEPDDYIVIIPKLVRHPIGILCEKVNDNISTNHFINKDNYNLKGVMGTFLHENEIVMIVDIYDIFESFRPDLYKSIEQDIILKDKRILLAEDTKFFQTVIIKFFHSLGMHVDLAENGNEAWEKLQQNNNYDIIITDIMMPYCDGFEFTNRVRKNPMYDHIPIMALTSMATQTYINRGKESGIDRYEIKLDKEKQKIALLDLLTTRTIREKI